MKKTRCVVLSLICLIPLIGCSQAPKCGDPEVKKAALNQFLEPFDENAKNAMAPIISLTDESTEKTVKENKEVYCTATLHSGVVSVPFRYKAKRGDDGKIYVAIQQ